MARTRDALIMIFIGILRASARRNSLIEGRRPIARVPVIRPGITADVAPVRHEANSGPVGATRVTSVTHQAATSSTRSHAIGARYLFPSCCRSLKAAEAKLLDVLKNGRIHSLSESVPSVPALLDFLEAEKPPPERFDNRTLLGNWMLEYTNDIPGPLWNELTQHDNDTIVDLRVVMSVFSSGKLATTAVIEQTAGRKTMMNMYSLMNQIKHTPRFSTDDLDHPVVEVTFLHDDLLVLRRDDPLGDMLQLNSKGSLRSVWRKVEGSSAKVWSSAIPEEKLAARRASLSRFGLSYRSIPARKQALHPLTGKSGSHGARLRALVARQAKGGDAVDPVNRSDFGQDNIRSLERRRDALLADLADVNRALEAEAMESARNLPKIGSRKSVFEPAFGYLSKSAGVYTEAQNADDANIPSSAFDLAIRNFGRELPNLIKTLSGSPQIDEPGSEEAAEFRAKLDKLVLDNDKVWAREKTRPKVEAPLVLLIPYYVLCWLLDVAFEGRPIARFWFLETVARIPYFAYVSSLHLYESLGWWRRSAETKRVHFAEEWNEFHHLLTMEALGGDQLWQDRFLAQHSAVAYYWVLVGLWLLSPSLSYKFSELIEAHAVDTYGEFVDANREILAELPAPRVSRLYYNGPDLFLFDEFQTSRPRGSRRVSCETLLDVFTNIRDDEAEHVATMAACQDPDVATSAPNVEAALISAAVLGGTAIAAVGGGDLSDAASDLSQAVSDGTAAMEAEGAAASIGEAAAGLGGVATLVQQLFSDGATSGSDVEEAAQGAEQLGLGARLSSLWRSLLKKDIM